MNKEGLLLVVSGPSGAGKGTICRAFIEANPKVNVSVSATTRPPRIGELDGVNYFFLTKAQFEHRIAIDEFYEYAVNYGNYYGTPKQFVEDKLKSGEDVILEIDIQGAMQVRKYRPDAIYIFILPPSMTELKNRIIKRGSETEESLNTRFNSAYSEIDQIDAYDYFIVNDDVEKGVAIMESIVMAERQRVNSETIQMITKIKEI